MKQDCRPVVDSGLRCSRCGYNLTGLTEKRCPECGCWFSPNELRYNALMKGDPIPGWDDRGGVSILAAFFRICRNTWFHPTDFAKSFPWAFEWRSVFRFWLAVRFVMVAILLGEAVLSSVVFALASSRGPTRTDTIVSHLALAAGILIGSVVCEGVLVLALRFGTRCRVVIQPEWPSTASVSWWGFVAFQSSFLVLTSTLSGIVLNLRLLSRGWGAVSWCRALDWLLPAVLLADLIWWRYCLGKGVRARTRVARERWIVTVSFSVAVIAGVIAGGCPAFMLLMSVFPI
jgi:hypothetical protein